MTKQTKHQAVFVNNLRAMGKQTGFTLVELMISIVLGLIVIAAALAIFIGGQRALNVQQGMGGVQESAIFGLNQLTYFVRHANLNTTADQKIGLNVEGSGIVFNANNFPATAINQRAARFTTANEAAAVTGALAASDSLTIQYMPTYTLTPNGSNTTFTSDMFDCEGNALRVTSSPSPDSQYVSVHRFYVARMPDAQQNASNTRYALYCDASFYDKAGRSTAAINSGTGVVANGGVVMIPDIEAFKVRLGVKNDNGNIRYMPINDYTALGNGGVSVTQRVVSIELGILVRSNENVGADGNIDATKTYNVAGTSVQMTTDNTGTKHLREAFSQVVALRNAQGE